MHRNNENRALCLEYTTPPRHPRIETALLRPHMIVELCMVGVALRHRMLYCPKSTPTGIDNYTYPKKNWRRTIEPPPPIAISVITASLRYI